jgi:hypothetical protein
MFNLFDELFLYRDSSYKRYLTNEKNKLEALCAVFVFWRDNHRACSGRDLYRFTEGPKLLLLLSLFFFA